MEEGYKARRRECKELVNKFFKEEFYPISTENCENWINPKIKDYFYSEGKQEMLDSNSVEAIGGLLESVLIELSSNEFERYGKKYQLGYSYSANSEYRMFEVKEL